MNRVAVSLLAVSLIALSTTGCTSKEVIKEKRTIKQERTKSELSTLTSVELNGGADKSLTEQLPIISKVSFDEPLNNMSLIKTADDGSISEWTYFNGRTHYSCYAKKFGAAMYEVEVINDNMYIAFDGNTYVVEGIPYVGEYTTYINGVEVVDLLPCVLDDFVCDKDAGNCFTSNGEVDCKLTFPSDMSVMIETYDSEESTQWEITPAYSIASSIDIANAIEVTPTQLDELLQNSHSANGCACGKGSCSIVNTGCGMSCCD